MEHPSGPPQTLRNLKAGFPISGEETCAPHFQVKGARAKGRQGASCRYNAVSPRSSFRIRMASSTLVTKILPSPILPVLAARRMA